MTIRRFLLICLVQLGMSVGCPQLWADVKLPSKCEAFLPEVFYREHVIYQSDVDRVMGDKYYAQKKKPSGTKRYWIAYSDRSENTTYTAPSEKSDIFSHLNFNEKVRIAKIKNGFALVYSEPDFRYQYPNISDNAESRGWVPMKNLLLWNSCPTDAKGIYDKALLAVNIDANDKVADMGRVYLNPETRSGENRMKTDMNIYFVMKKGENDLVLLACLAKMDGTYDQVLFGWVSQSSYIHWNHRLFLEPTWDENDVEFFNGKEVPFFSDEKLQHKIFSYQFGKFINPEEEQTSPTRWRMPKEALRFPLLDNDSKDTTIFKCVAMIDTSLYDEIKPKEETFYINQGIGCGRCLKMRNPNSCLSAVSGYTPKKDESGRDYWKLILLISSDEFNNLIQRLEPLNKIARTNSDDRKAYVDAMKALVRSLIPDITDEEMEKKSVGEIMGLIAGLNESSMALRGPSLIDIQDPKVVNHEQYYELVSSFATKCRKLINIKTKRYRYALNFNNVKYYWIPIEDLPI